LLTLVSVSHKNKKDCPKFSNAIDKYGFPLIARGFKVLSVTKDLDKLNLLERKFIKQYSLEK